MTKHVMRWGFVVVVLVTSGWAVSEDGFVLRAEEGTRWFKGNTHAHSLWSDGDAAPEMAVQWYREHGYNFFCLTDHNVMSDGSKVKHRPISEKGALTPARVAEIEAAFGADWLERREVRGHPEIKLKDLAALREHFEKPGEFLLITGEEITGVNPDVHINVLNLRELILPALKLPPAETVQADFQNVFDQIKRTGVPMLAHLNHPNFAGGVPVEALIAVPEARFFEVYNGHPAVANSGEPGRRMPSTDRFWDIALAVRLAKSPDAILYGFATDDTHDYFSQSPKDANPGRGWTMVLADTLTTEALLDAYERGAFYASTGVTLDEIRVGSGEYSVQIHEVPGVTYTTYFIGTLKGVDLSSQTPKDDAGNEITDVTRQYSDKIGQVLLETQDNPAVYAFKGNEQYVRVRVVSSKMAANPVESVDFERAWTQPVVPSNSERK